MVIEGAGIDGDPKGLLFGNSQDSFLSVHKILKLKLLGGLKITTIT